VSYIEDCVWDKRQDASIDGSQAFLAHGLKACSSAFQIATRNVRLLGVDYLTTDKNEKLGFGFAVCRTEKPKTKN
jgi:hypothetical protein